MGETRNGRLQTAVVSLAISLSERENPFCFIHEMDHEALKSGYHFLSEQLSIYYQLGPKNVSFDVHNYIGSFIAPKYELGCQVADVSGYVALKSERQDSSFARDLAAVYEKHETNFITNELIWWNDSDKQG